MTGDAAARLAAAESRIAELTRENERLRSSSGRADDDPATTPLSIAIYETLRLNVSDYALIATDMAGRITLWNQAAADIFGWASEPMIGQALDRIFTPEDRAAGCAEREMAIAMRDGRAADNRWLLRSDGPPSSRAANSCPCATRAVTGSVS